MLPQFLHISEILVKFTDPAPTIYLHPKIIEKSKQLTVTFLYMSILNAIQ